MAGGESDTKGVVALSTVANVGVAVDEAGVADASGDDGRKPSGYLSLVAVGNVVGNQVP